MFQRKIYDLSEQMQKELNKFLFTSQHPPTHIELRWPSAQKTYPSYCCYGYLSEARPEAKEPIRTPAMKSVVVREAIQERPHTRVYWNRAKKTMRETIKQW